jgi:hypothetical protein
LPFSQLSTSTTLWVTTIFAMLFLSEGRRRK